MIAVLINAVVVAVGACIGLLFKKGIPERITKPIMTGLALCVLYIGISGSLCGENALIAILSMVIGAIIGTLLDIDGKMNGLGDKLEAKFSKNGEKGSFASAFVNTSIIMCVGAMAIVGSINAGLLGDNSVLYTKTMLDGVSSIIFAASLGPGVIFTSLSILIYQGFFCLLAGALQPVLTDAAINEMACVGYIQIIGIGLNMLGVTKLKIADYMPAIIIAPILVWLFSVI